MRYLVLLLLVITMLCLYTSCTTNTSRDRMTQLVKIWENRQINYPLKTVFTIYGEDTIENYTVFGQEYSIVTYIDSLGCIGCKLQAKQWKSFIEKIDSVSDTPVPVNFFIHPKSRRELLSILRNEILDIPVCIDLNDSFRILNDFPSDLAFRTFLVDKNSKVVAIGNPMYNPKIRELYLKIIQSGKVRLENESKPIQTVISVAKYLVSLDTFDWQKEQKATFTLKNAGDKPLVIQDVSTSCGCTIVEYQKEPVRPRGSLDLHVTYKADHPEHFSKTITVYCNAEASPIKLTISGDAK